MPAPFFTSNPAEFQRLEGLYIFEQNPPGFIRGVSLGAVGVFGPTVRGPVDTPVEITSEARFLEVFGGRDYGLGGAIVNKVWRALLNKPFGKLVVVRAAAAAAVKASFTLETAAGGAGTAVLRVDASSPGAWGNQVQFKVEAATDGVGTHFNLSVKLNGQVVTYENLDINSAGVDNTLSIVGDDLANWVTLTKLADGRPVNNAAGIDGADSLGFVNLGETVAAFTSVLGADGAIAGTDYTAAGRAIDQIKAYAGVGIVFSAEDTEALVTAINTALVTAAAAATDRMFIVWTGDHTDTVSQAKTYFDGLLGGDRIIKTFNSPYTLDTETATLIRVPPAEWMASILSQTDVDIHPGEEATKAFTAGISKLTYESLTREDYVTLRDAGICGLEKDEGFLFVSGVTADKTPGKTEITRRRSADFLQLSASGRLKHFVKKKNIASLRRVMGGELIAFSQSLQNEGRVVEAFAVDQASVNTDAQRAQGVEYILWRVKLIGHMLHLILKTEIGTGVTIEA